ncbi:hypothetical protein NL676_004150 [Syzygium grande]|nr:hypothetical protein NL676_004150 [Syzygium grande]
MKFAFAMTLLVVTVLGIAVGGCHCKIVQFIFGNSLSDVGKRRTRSRQASAMRRTCRSRSALRHSGPRAPSSSTPDSFRTPSTLL